MYSVNDIVRFKKQLCPCVGGGFAEMEGRIVGIIDAPNGKWYQIDQPQGIAYAQEQHIIKKLS